MAYSLYTQAYGSAKANSPVTIRRSDNGLPAIILSSSTGGVLNTNGKATLDSSGNLSVYIDTSYTWLVEINDVSPPRTILPTIRIEDNSPTALLDDKGALLMYPASFSSDQLAAGAVLPQVMLGKTSAQLSAAPTTKDTAVASNTVFYDVADPTKTFRINSAGTLFVRQTDVGGAFNVLGKPLVASRGLVEKNLSNGTDPTSSYRSRHVAPFACMHPSVVLANIVCNTGGQENVSTSTCTFSAAIEYPVGIVNPVTFSGQPTVSLQNGTMVVSDPCGIDLPANSIFWVRTCIVQSGSLVWPMPSLAVTDQTNGGQAGDAMGFKITAAQKGNPTTLTTNGNHNMPTGTSTIKIQNASGMTGLNATWTATRTSSTQFTVPYDSSAAPSLTGYATGVGTDMTIAGSGVMSGAISSQTIHSPAAVIGNWPYATPQSWAVIFGDSIAKGSGDTTYSAGWIVLGLGGFTAPVMPFMNLAISGTRISQFVDQTNVPTQSEKRRRLGLYAPYTFIEYGINDIISGSRTADQVANDNLSLATNIYSRGGRVIINTLTPQTTSPGNAFDSPSNQTKSANEANRVAYNNWVRAGCPIDSTLKTYVAPGTSGALLAGQYGHPIWKYIDPWVSVEVDITNTPTINGGYWICNGSNQYATADGTHPTTTIHQIAATAVPVSSMIPF